MKGTPVRSVSRLLTTLAFAGMLSSLGLASSTAMAGPMDQHTLDKRANGVPKALKLDGEKQTAVRDVLEAHFQAVQVWHDAHAAKLSALWMAWAEARNPKHADAAKAAADTEHLDQLYAQFGAQHDAFIVALGHELTAAQVEKVKDVLTKSPGMERTYKAYLRMIPNFTAEQKGFIHHKLELAREESLDSASSKETINLFKVRKVEIETYIDAQGLDYKKAYAAFCERIKEETKTRKAKNS